MTKAAVSVSIINNLREALQSVFSLLSILTEMVLSSSIYLYFIHDLSRITNFREAVPFDLTCKQFLLYHCLQERSEERRRSVWVDCWNGCESTTRSAHFPSTSAQESSVPSALDCSPKTTSESSVSLTHLALTDHLLNFTS